MALTMGLPMRKRKYNGGSGQARAGLGINSAKKQKLLEYALNSLRHFARNMLFHKIDNILKAYFWAAAINKFVINN